MTAVLLPDERQRLGAAAAGAVRPADPDAPLEGVELVVVLGGDGTILRAAEVVRGSDGAAARGQPRACRVPGRGEREDLAEAVDGSRRGPSRSRSG